MLHYDPLSSMGSRRLGAGGGDGLGKAHTLSAHETQPTLLIQLVMEWLTQRGWRTKWHELMHNVIAIYQT